LQVAKETIVSSYFRANSIASPIELKLVELTFLMYGAEHHKSND
jgi:hypothetical protein